MKLRAGAISDIGRARERNEDSYLLREPLFAVADGMGGHRGGDVASALALESFDAMDPTAPDVAHALVERVKDANRRVLGRSLADRALRGMGTTLTAIVAGDDKVYLAHVGDSRAYLLRNGVLQQLSEDHTLVQRMVREGRLSSEEAAVHPQRSILTRAIGVEDDIAVDQLTLDVHPGDRILLCSDGLTSMLDGARIQEILNSEPDPQAAAQLLVEAANRAGGDDNITAIVVDVQEASGDGSGPVDGRDHRAGSGTGEMLVVPRPPEGSGGAASDVRAGLATGVSTAVAGSPDDVIGRDACDAGFAHRFGGRHIPIAGEGDGLRKALALRHDFNHGFIAGWRAAVKFHPAVDHDEKRSRRIVLAHYPLVRPQHESCCGRDNVLDGLRFESPENRDAGNDLKIAGRQF